MAAPRQGVFKALHHEKYKLAVRALQSPFDPPVHFGAGVCESVLSFVLTDFQLCRAERHTEEPYSGVRVLDGLCDEGDLGADALPGHCQKLDPVANCAQGADKIVADTPAYKGISNRGRSSCSSVGN